MSLVGVVCYRWRPLLRADHSSRGVIPTVVRRCVWSRNLKNEEVMANFGPHPTGKKNLIVNTKSSPPLEKLLFFRVVTKFLTFRLFRMFITLSAKAHHLSGLRPYILFI
jgi:hypothetical protein